MILLDIESATKRNCIENHATDSSRKNDGKGSSRQETKYCRRYAHDFECHKIACNFISCCPRVALRLYLDILDQTGKSSKAIELLQSDLKELFKVSADHTQALAYFFHRTKQYQELSTLTSVWLCESPDDWEAIQLYVESVYHLGQDQDTSPGNALQTAHVFIQDLQKKVLQDKHPKRGPFLAETLLHKTMGDDSGVSEAIATFFERFGSRTSWFDDLKPYKSQIKDWSDILEKLDTIMKGKNENPDVSEIDRLRSYVNLKKVVRLSSSNWTRDRINQEVQELVSMYTKSLPLSKFI